jgi:uncharacterized phage protein gp47/JayE
VADAPPYLTGDTESDIYGRILADVRAAGYDLAEGTVEQTLARDWSIQLYAVGVVGAARVQQDMFLTTATPLKLPDHGVQHGVSRLAATPAVQPMELLGDAGAVIPAGTRFITPATRTVPSVAFDLDAAVTLDGSGVGTGAATATASGTVGNVPANTIRFTASAVPHLTSATNPSGASIPGTDDEAWETFRQRIKLAAAADPGMANVDAYAGVGWVNVEPLWNGEGTVRVVILDALRQPASGDLIDLVQTVLDPTQDGSGYGLGDIAHVVTVATASTVVLVLTIPGLVPEPNTTLAAAQANALAAADAYVATLDPGATFVIRDAEAAIIQAAGVADIGDILVAAGGGGAARANVQLTAVQVADLDTASTVWA